MAEYTHIRVRRETAEWLNQEIDRMAAAYADGRQDTLPVTESQNPKHRGITVDAMICYLLDFKQQHRERCRKARKRRRKAGPGAAGQ